MLIHQHTRDISFRSSCWRGCSRVCWRGCSRVCRTSSSLRNSI